MNQIILSSKDSSEIFLSHVKKALSIVENNSLGVLISGKIRTSDLIQSLILSKDDHFHERIFKPIILKESIRSEIISPGSGEMTLLLSLLLLDDLLPQIISGNHYKNICEEIENQYTDFLEEISRISRKIDKKTFDRIISQKFDTQKIRELVKISIKLSGLSRKIYVEKINKFDTSIVVSDGYIFPIYPDKNFIKSEWKRENVNCAIIDGVILEVSEIHHLLTCASETGEPYLLFTRGLSPDVKNTIYVNNSRGTVDIIPIEIPVSEETINIFSDLSAVCGCDITSSYKGDLISKTVAEKLSIVDSVNVSKNRITIKNKSSKRRVAIQVREIEQKRDEILEPQNRVLFDKRIKSLSSGIVRIKVGQEDLLKDPAVIEKLDKFFRSISPLVRYGIIRNSDILKKDVKNNNFSKLSIKTVKNRGLKDISYHNLLISSKMSISIVESILSTGCILPCNQS